jgi:hypothetical protein
LDALLVADFCPPFLAGFFSVIASTLGPHLIQQVADPNAGHSEMAQHLSCGASFLVEEPDQNVFGSDKFIT